jgi:hypothetical protein
VVGREWRRRGGSGGGGVVMLGPRCRSSLARVVALGGAGPPLLFVVGACGPSLPFVFGARRCRSLLARIVAVHCWHASLPFFIGVRRCCSPLVRVVALVRDRYSWVGDRRRPWVGHCRLWMGVVVVHGGSLW